MGTTAERIEAELAATTDAAARITLLNKLVNTIFRTDPRRSLALAEEAYHLAVTLDDTRMMADSLWSIAVSRETLSEYPEAMAAARRTLELYRKCDDPGETAYTLMTIGVLSIRMSDHTSALEAFTQALSIFRGMNKPLSAAKVLNNIAAAYEAIGDFPAALEAFLEGLRINQEHEHHAGVALITGNIGNIYAHLHDADRAFEYYHRALEISRRLNDTYSVALTLGNIASIYQERGDQQAAFDALKEALEIFQRMGEQRYEATTLCKLGGLYKLRGEPDGAMERFQQVAAIAASIGSRDVLAEAQLRIGDLHFSSREYHQARAVLQQGLATARAGAIPAIESDILLLLARTHAALGEYADGCRGMTEHARLQETLFGQERQRAIAEMQARFDVERAERERELFRLKSEHLEEMMRQRSKELASMAMHLMQKNSFLQKLRKHILQLSAEHPESDEVLQHLLRQITGHIHDDDGWRRFRQEFQLVHHDFIRSLSERYPRLTPGELKVCTFLKLNLSNKEIARLLSVSVRNVESHRYWIRKKIGLASDINLSTYLASL